MCQEGKKDELKSPVWFFQLRKGTKRGFLHLWYISERYHFAACRWMAWRKLRWFFLPYSIKTPHLLGRANS